MKIKPNPPESITTELLKNDAKKPIAIPANEQLARDTRILSNEKGVNLAVTSNDQLRTVLEELSHLRVWASKSYAGQIKDSDKNVVQTRIDIIKDDISKRLADTEFNKYRNLEPDPKQTQGKPMKIKNTALETLGIEDFDIRKAETPEKIDIAMRTIRRALQKRSSKAQHKANENTLLNMSKVRSIQVKNAMQNGKAKSVKV